VSGVILAGAAALLSCRAAPIENRMPVGERFPSVVGNSLDGDEVALPEALAGAPAVLILGYVQDAQFDADRWLFGLLQAETPVRVLEVPTIPGLFPTLIGGTIDDGMRSGIPSEDWSVVVTVYGSPAKGIVALTGNEGPRNVRVLLLDGDGIVRWMHDRGFSAGKLLELDRTARELAGG
jgi:hypothetical protein